MLLSYCQKKRKKEKNEIGKNIFLSHFFVKHFIMYSYILHCCYCCLLSSFIQLCATRTVISVVYILALQTYIAIRVERSIFRTINSSCCSPFLLSILFLQTTAHIYREIAYRTQLEEGMLSLMEWGRTSNCITHTQFIFKQSLVVSLFLLYLIFLMQTLFINLVNRSVCC